MQHDRYHHYDDWEEKMKGTFDQFNLLELPKNRDKDAPRLYFIEQEFRRQIPKGIFPDAKGPRAVLRPPGQAIEYKDAMSVQDSMTKFERSPMKTMVKEELIRNIEATEAEYSPEIQAITNL